MCVLLLILICWTLPAATEYDRGLIFGSGVWV